MATGVVHFFDGSRFLGSSGGASGATVFFYYTGTTTLAPIYADIGLTTPLVNPVSVAVGAVVPDIYLSSDITYRRRIVFTDGSVHDVDPLPVIPTTGTVYVTTKTALANLDPTKVSAVYLNGDLFLFKTGDRSSLVSSDPLQGLYIAPTSAPTGASGCWERQWDGVHAYPEWFGAVINTSTDSYAALQACLDLTGRLFLGKGAYQSSRGLVLPQYCVIEGFGDNHTAIQVNHATDHLMRQTGTFPGTYAGGANLRNFILSRGVAPTVPADPANDINQGHGLHFSMVSNVRAENVYVYNNLVEVYGSNLLSPRLVNIRGAGQTAQSRWYGFYLDGSTIGSFGGPSGFPSATFHSINMGCSAGVTQGYNGYLKGSMQDVWIVDFEAGGGTVQLFVDSNGANAGDFHIVRPILDGYVGKGMWIKGTPLGSSLNIIDAWVAPALGAPNQGIHIDGSHGVTVSARGDCSNSSGVVFLSVNDSTQLDANVRVKNCQTPVSMTSVNASDVKVHAFKNYSSGSFGNIVTVVSGSRNRISVTANLGDTQKYVTGIAADASASEMVFDVAGIYGGTTVNNVVVNGSTVTTQGKVGSHVVINPGLTWSV